MNIYPILSAGLFLFSLWIPVPVETETEVAPLPTILVEEELPQVQLPPAQFLVAMESQGFLPGTRLTVDNLSGAFSPERQWNCPWVVGHYTVTVDGQYITQFQLEENAAITNVSGCGWSDGEVLHVEPSIQWVILVKDAPLGHYKLTDGQAEQKIYGTGTVAFPNLKAGTYTVILPDDTTRVVTLTEKMPQVVLGLG